MRFNAHPRRLLLIPCLLALFGCTTPKPAPVVKAEPTVTATPPAPPPPPPAPPPVAPTPPPPPAPLTLSNGPWTESSAQEATIAVVVSVRFAGQDREHVGVHFLRPARTTTYRLVQLRSETPATLAQKEIPEACSSWFHLDNDETATASTRHSVHSTLKQFPIDPTRTITLNLRVNSQQNGSELHIDESLLMNGVGHAVCGKSEIAASIDVVPPETALRLLAPPQATEPTPATTANATPSDWDLLHKKFQLTGHETRNDGWFQLTREASLQFPDIRFFTAQIEISEDHSLIKLRGPVRIEWDGRSMTSGDANIRVTADTVQFEASDIQSN